MFSSDLPDEMTFDRGGIGRLGIASGDVTLIPRIAMSDRSIRFHEECTARVHAPIDKVFAHLDDPVALSAHMGRSSAMMMGDKSRRGGKKHKKPTRPSGPPSAFAEELAKAL